MPLRQHFLRPRVLPVSRYLFGTRTAEFHVCSGCGVVPVVTSEIAGRVQFLERPP